MPLRGAIFIIILAVICAVGGRDEICQWLEDQIENGDDTEQNNTNNTEEE